MIVLTKNMRMFSFCALFLISAVSLMSKDERPMDMYVGMACQAIYAKMRVCELEVHKVEKVKIASDLAQMMFIYYYQTRMNGEAANETMDRVIKSPYTAARRGDFDEFSDDIKKVLENPFPGNLPNEIRINDFVLKGSDYEDLRRDYIKFLTVELEESAK